MTRGRYYEAVRAFQRSVLARALAEHTGNVTHAARALGLQRTYLLRLMHRHGLPVRAPLRAGQWAEADG
jgi:transcriptional regulator with GAF, ATPase, and Fis domain